MFDRNLTKKWKEESYSYSKLGLCRWCHQDVKRISSRRITFCSDNCVYEYSIRADSGFARKEVYKRDKGVCSICNLNCSKFFKGLKEYIRSDKSKSKKVLAEEWFKKWNIQYVKWEHRSTFWDVDHITPVIEGGGLCGLDGLRTLCLICHINATRDLKKRMKEGYYGYIARNEGIERYVGIGIRNRWNHVNSGYSHNHQLNSVINNGGEFEIEVIPIKTWKEACEWEVETIKKYGRKDIISYGTLFNHTDGGDGGDTNSGTIWAHNPKNNEHRMITGDIPDGWVMGRSKDIVSKIRTTRGYIRITNGDEEKLILSTDDIPDGWRKGRCKTPTKNKRWVYNPTTKECRMLDYIPDGWVVGRSGTHLIWITNGDRQRKWDPELSIPDGWVVGTKDKGKFDLKWIYNPITKERRRVKLNDVPEGWIVGMEECNLTKIKREKDKYIWINDGEHQKLHDKKYPIPDGWVMGFKKNRLKQSKKKVKNGET